MSPNPGEEKNSHPGDNHLQEKSLFTKLWKNKKARFFLISGLIFLCIITAVSIFLHSQIFKSYLIKKADQYLQTHYQLSMQVGSINYSLSRLSLELEDIRIIANTPTDIPLESFSAQRIYLDFAYSTLFSKKTHIQRLVITQPQVSIKPEKQTSPVPSPKKTSPQKPFRLRIDDFLIENGSINLNNQTLSIGAVFKDISSEIQYLQKDRVHSGFLQAQKGIIEFRESTVKLDQLGLEFRFDNDSLFLDRLQISSDAGTLKVSGEVNDYQKIPKFQLKIDSSLPLDTASTLFNLDGEYSGILRMTAAVEGEGEKWKLKGSLKGENAVLFNIPIAELEAAFKGNESDISLNILNLAAAQGHIKGRVDFPLGSEKLFSAELRWDALNLSHFSDIFPALPFRTSSITSGYFSAKGDLSDLMSLSSEGHLTFKPIEPDTTFPENTHLLSGRIEFKTSQGDIHILPSELIFDTLHLYISGQRQKNTSFQTDFRITVDDLSRIEPLLSSFAQAGSIPRAEPFQPLPLSGKVSLSGKIHGMWPNPRASLELTGSEISFQQGHLKSLQSVLTYQSGRINLRQLNLQLPQGRVEGNGHISFDPQKMILGEKVDLNFTVEDMELGSLTPLFPDEYAITGSFSGKIEATGSFSDPDVAITASVSQLSFNEEEISRINIKGQYAQQRIRLSQLEVYKGNGFLKGYLDIDLKQQAYSLKFSGKELALADFSKINSGEIPLAGKINLDMEGQGTFKKPEFVFNLTVDEAKISDTTLEPIKVEANADGSKIHFRLTLPAGKTSLEAHLPMQAPYIIKGNFKTSDLDVFSFTKPTEEETPLPYASKLSAEAEFSIPLDDWQNLYMLINMEETEVAFNGLKIQNQNPIVIKIENNTIDLNKINFGFNDGRISVQGKISLESLLSSKSTGMDPPALDILVRFSGINPGSFIVTKPQDNVKELGGLITGYLHIYGQPEQMEYIQMEGELEIFHLFWDQYRLENSNKILFNLKNNIFSLDDLHLAGHDSFIRAAGKIDLTKEPEIDARLSVQLDTAILTPFLENILLDGRLNLDLTGKGPVINPVISGRAEIQDGYLQPQAMPITATDIKGVIEFTQSTVTISSIAGTVNGGKIEIKGNLGYQDFMIDSARLELNASGVQLSYPEGFHAQAATHLTLAGKDKSWQLTGDTSIFQAYYNTNFSLGNELLNRIRLKRIQMETELPPFLQELDLNIGLDIPDPFIIDNNLVNLGLAGNIRILGTVVEPRLSGRITNRYMGEIIFGERTYQVEKAEIDFLGTDPLEGHLNLIAHTSASHNHEELDITFSLTGPISNLQYSLSSFPPRSEGELASLLITGFGTEKLKTDTANILGNQLLQYFASPLASPVTEKIKNLLKAEEVSVVPINIATEEDPGARFTFRKGLSRHVDVIYSIDISNTQQQTWILDYNLNRNFSIQSFRKDNGSYGSSLKHRFSLGKQDPPAKFSILTQKKQARMKEVRIQGDLFFPYNTLAKKIRLKIGAPFIYSDLQKSIDKLTAFYKQNRYLNIVISTEINFEDQDAVITLNISPKNPAILSFSGDPFSSKIKKEIIRSWNGRLPEELALSEAKKLISKNLQGRGYADALVEARIDPETEQTQYQFHIKRGARFRIRDFQVNGHSSISTDILKKTIASTSFSQGKGLWILLYDFNHVRSQLKSLFAEKGYLNIKLDRPQVILNRKAQYLDITLKLDQGRQSHVQRIVLKGNQRFSENELKAGFSLKENSIYQPSLLPENTNHLFNHYRSKGFQDVQISLAITPQPESPDFTLIYTITEGDLHTISDIKIYGNRRTPDHVIRRELMFREGDVLDMKLLFMSQKKLYDLSIFKSVSIKRQPQSNQSTQASIAIEIEEDSLLAVNYGLRFNSEEKFEGFGQLDFINIFGRGRNGLLYYRQNKRQKNIRFSLASPYLFGKKFNTLHSFYYLKETESYFQTEEMGYSLQQEIRLPFDFSLSYLYRISHIHTYELESFGPFAFDFELLLSELQTFLVRDTRINKLDARQGSFFSFSFTYSPEFLKSDLTYISLFCQYSLYKDLGKNFIWASNYRFGYANAFDQVLIPSKRFYAGGGNSIRGFKRDMVGPYNPYFEASEGGEVLFIMNQELRFPIFKWLGGVAFFDTGNVYPTFSDLDFLDVRNSLGLGLRLNTPVALIRFDYGFNLSPLPHEAKRVFFLSIGQAF